MFKTLLNKICLNKGKMLFLPNDKQILFTNNHNLGLLSDVVIDDIANVNIDDLSYTTKVLLSKDNDIIRNDFTNINGNRISKQRVDNQIHYHLLVIKNNKLLQKIWIFTT